MRRKRQIWKRIAAFVVCFCLLLGECSFTSFAQTEEKTVEYTANAGGLPDYSSGQGMGYSYLSGNQANIMAQYGTAGTWIQTTYANGGYCYQTKNLSNASVQVTASFINEGRYVRLGYKVTAGNTPVVGGKLGIYADIQIGDNDFAKVEPIVVDRNGSKEVIGIKMVDNHVGCNYSENAQYNLYFRRTGGVTSVDTYWYGHYIEMGNLWERQLESVLYEVNGVTLRPGYAREGDRIVYGGQAEGSSGERIGDSAFGVSWNVNLAANQSKTYSIILGVGDAADPPVLKPLDSLKFLMVEPEQVNCGRGAVKVSAKVSDKAGMTDMMFVSFDGEGSQKIAEVTANGSDVDIFGDINLDSLSAGTHTMEVWAMNSAGVASEAEEYTLVIPEHTWIFDAGNPGNREATCAAPGIQVYYCDVCGAVKNEELAQLEHDYLYSYDAEHSTADRALLVGVCQIDATHETALVTLSPPESCAYTGGEKPAVLTKNENVYSHVATAVSYEKQAVEGDPGSFVAMVGVPAELGTYRATVTLQNGPNTAEGSILYVIGHEHDWAETWMTDETNHWHVCKLAGCPLPTATNSLGAHEWELDEVTLPATCMTAGTGVERCRVCGITRPAVVPPVAHQYDYTADGAVITGVCQAGCNGVVQAILTAPEDAVENGAAWEAGLNNQTPESVTVLYWKKDADGNFVPMADSPKSAGVYLAAITIEGATASVEYEIGPRPATPQPVYSVRYLFDNQTGGRIARIDENKLREAVEHILTDSDRTNGNTIEVTLRITDRTRERPDASEAASVLGQIPAEALGAFYDIVLMKKITWLDGTVTEELITDTSSPEGEGLIPITLEIPSWLQGGSGFGMIRVHGTGTGKIAEVLGTVQTGNELTFATNKFSTYAIGYTYARDAMGNPIIPDVLSSPEDPLEVKLDREPQTGSEARKLPFTTLGFLAGIAFLLELLAEKNKKWFVMSENRKKRLVDRLVAWGRNRGEPARMLAISAIFVILCYYHGIGKNIGCNKMAFAGA